MLYDIVSILSLVAQLLGLVVVAGLLARLVFGFALDREGRVLVSNRRGKALVHLASWLASFFKEKDGIEAKKLTKR